MICSVAEMLSSTMSFTTRWMNSTYLRGGEGGGEEGRGRSREEGRRGEEERAGEMRRGGEERGGEEGEERRVVEGGEEGRNEEGRGVLFI